MVAAGLRQQDIQELAKTQRMMLRDGVCDLLRLAQQRQVPVHVFSAGIRDIITAFFGEHGGACGAHVVANEMLFDSASRHLTGFAPPLIHSFNKNSATLQAAPSWPLVADRPAVLLLGDSVSDTNMANGFAADTVLSVGFLNDREDERRSAHCNAFDVVLVGDGGMDPVVALLAALVAE